MVVLIISGALLGGVIFEDFTFSLLGGLLGFVVARINDLSKQVKDLKLTVHNLQSTQKPLQPEQVQSVEPQHVDHNEVEGAKANYQTTRLEADTERVPDKGFATHSIAKSAQTEDVKIASESLKSENQEKIQSAQSSLAAEQQVKPEIAPTKSHQSTSNSSPQNQQPDFVMKMVNFVIDYFTQGNIVVRVGAVILFFGVAFLLKFAAENVEIPMEFRLIAVSVGAIVLLAFGWRLRDKKQGYGLILQGTAVGILYLTLFAAFRLYDMVPSGLAFSFMFLFSGLAMTLAILQNARSLAVLSVVGGFLAPILSSSGSGNYVALFSYYSILNLGIFAVAWFKSWRLLNLIGFAFTFIISTAWGVTKYQPEYFLTTEPFLIFFFLLYSAIALLFATKQKPSLKGYLDTTLIFGLPLISFALQAAMVKDFEYGLARSSFALGAFYIATAYFVLRSKSEYLKVIAEAYLALGIIFTSLVIPFALDGQWTAAAWAIEGAGLVWVGLRQARWFPKYFGALIQLVGGIVFLSQIKFNHVSTQVFDGEILGIFFVAIAGIFSSYNVWKRQESLHPFEAIAYLFFLIWGMMWWYLGGIGKISDLLEYSSKTNGMLMFISLSGLLWYLIEKRFQWTVLSQLTWVTLSLVILIGLEDSISHSHLMRSWSSVFWLFAIVSFYWSVYNREMSQKEALKSDSGDDVYIPQVPAANMVLHFIAFLSLFGFSLQEIDWVARYFEFSNTGWGISLFGLTIAVWLYLLRFGDRWPIKFNPTSYSIAGMGLLLFSASIWSLFLNFSHAGNIEPLIYLPFLNPLDIVQGFLFILVLQATKKLSQTTISLPNGTIKIISLIFVFIWLNVILLRCIHHWANVYYDFDDLFRSFLVQTSISIFWTIIGLAGAIYGARINSRKIWVYAAGLIGVVVLKLFTIDLDNSSSIERIVSFVVVGLLLLIVGYFAPLPSKIETREENTDES